MIRIRCFHMEESLMKSLVDRNFTSDPADDLDPYDKEKTGGNG